MTGLRQGFRSRTVLMLSSASALTFAAWAPYWLEWPQLFNDRYGVGIWIVGWLYCLFTVARMIGAEAVVRSGIEARDRGARLAAMVAGASALLFVGGAMAHRPTVALVSLFVMNLCAGAMQPLTQSWFNEHVEADDRATLLSFNSYLFDHGRIARTARRRARGRRFRNSRGVGDGCADPARRGALLLGDSPRERAARGRPCGFVDRTSGSVDCARAQACGGLRLAAARV